MWSSIFPWRLSRHEKSQQDTQYLTKWFLGGKSSIASALRVYNTEIIIKIEK
jgi:hypothetical protein